MATIVFRRTDEVKVANCEPGDSVGDFVYITGPAVSGRIQTAKVDIDDGAKMPAVGVIVEKTSPTECVIQTDGNLDSVGLTPNALYFVGADSRLLEGPPPRPASGYRRIQGVGQADDGGNLLFQPQTIFHKVTA